MFNSDTTLDEMLSTDELIEEQSEINHYVKDNGELPPDLEVDHDKEEK